MTTNSAELKPFKPSEAMRRAVYMALHYHMNVQNPNEWQATDEAIAAMLKFVQPAAQGEQSKEKCEHLVRTTDGKTTQCDVCGAIGDVINPAWEPRWRAGSSEQVSERKAFDKWFEQRGVWPRITYEETFKAGYSAALASAAERKVTDAQIVKAVHAACGTGRVALTCTNNDGEEVPTDVARCFAKSLLNQQGEQTAPEGWISVKDRLPDELTGVIVTDGKFVNMGDHEAGDWQIDEPWQVDPKKVTHWMPLPEVPSTAQKDGGME